MTGPSIDPMTQRAMADAIVQRAADQLRDLLRQLAVRITPFPPFPGAMFAYGIEVEPPPGVSADVGCVVLGDDGALYELQVGLDQQQMAQGGDAMNTRHEELVPLVLPPAAYVGYAHRAVIAATEYLEQQRPS
ncbi:MAG: hypothetical protein O2919_11255 [Chloroflexi bacterium]|nr:hypothetical protein [Chloroflexota bacterium]